MADLLTRGNQSVQKIILSLTLSAWGENLDKLSAVERARLNGLFAGWRPRYLISALVLATPTLIAFKLPVTGLASHSAEHKFYNSTTRTCGQIF